MSESPRKQSFQDFRRKVFDTIQIASGTDPLSRVFDIIIIALIVLSIVITTIFTFPLSGGLLRAMTILDAICMIVFTIEYILRVITADFLYPTSRMPALRFIFSGGGIIDLLSFLPFYLDGLVPHGVVVFRLIRVARILRLFRINRYSDPVFLIMTVLRKKASQLAASLFLVLVLMLSSSLLMYYAEHEAQPTAFRNAFSGLWWAVSTLSTTGYGDIYPVTTLGRIIGILISLLGLAVVAVPTGIITAGFIETVGNGAAENEDGAHNALRNAHHVTLDLTGGDTYIEAPASRIVDGNTIEQIALERCVGRCIVETAHGNVTPEWISEVVYRASPAASNRLLLRGDCRITPEAAQYMNEIGIVLCGLGSQDAFDPETHTELLRKNMVLLRGLSLGPVEDGEYFLSAVPLREEGADRAPCRAFIMP